MSFAFKPDDASVEAALRRIAREELGAACKALRLTIPGQETGAGPLAVHGLRKHTKKLRGLLRLVRPVFPAYGAANASLRDGARHLAVLRDAEVRLDTFRLLLADLPRGSVSPAADAVLAAEVASVRDSGSMGRLCGTLLADLTELRRSARRWTLTEGGWAALKPGLIQTWRKARRGRKCAARALALGGGAAPFHDWRKSVKHHWYQARLLDPIWPEMFAPQVTAIDRLGEDLGAHNDIDLLIVYMAAHPDRRLASLAWEGPFLRQAQARRDALARSCLAQGAKLLAERPEALARRWECWWRDWRIRA